MNFHLKDDPGVRLTDGRLGADVININPEYIVPVRSPGRRTCFYESSTFHVHLCVPLSQHSTVNHLHINCHRVASYYIAKHPSVFFLLHTCDSLTSMSFPFALYLDPAFK